MKTYAMMILGCKVNDYEATYVRENMNKHFFEVSFKEKADIYLIFTCCVTNTAEAKTRKFIHNARRNNPNAYICAIGCLPQVKSSDDVFKDVDLIVGSYNKDKIVDLVVDGVKNNEVLEIINPQFENMFIEEYPTKSRAFLKIQDGCNQFCSYCIIPYSRGRERSCNHIDVINQAIKLSKTSNEIVLTGIHTGRYNDGEYDLYKLLVDLCKIDDIKTIRLSSIEITEVNDQIIDLMKESNKIAHHLHVPIQSCNDSVLKNMHRPYTFSEFYNRVEYIRKEIPDISISTDLIVGFPNETDNCFSNVIDNLKRIKFSFIHVFPYSRKAGTVADKMDGHIDPKIKKERVNLVLELQKEITSLFYKSFIGKNVEVLVEKKRNGFSYGYSKQYIYLKIKGEYKIGDIINVEVKEEMLDEA